MPKERAMQRASAMYPERYFAVQILFAQRIAEIANLPLTEALLSYTSLYRILGIEGKPDAASPDWQAYLREIDGVDQPTALTYQVYLQRYPRIPKFTDFPHWGCFAYDYLADQMAIKLHFSNQDTSGYGALSHQRQAIRMDELRAMFRHIQNTHPQARMVSGASWLYNWEAYRRLFPPAFGQSTQVDSPHFQARSLWGQFLQHTWQVNEEVAARFLQRGEELCDLHHLAECFPYQVLTTRGALQDFLTFYQV